MALLFFSTWDDDGRWQKALAGELPGLDFRVWTADGENVGDPAEIDYALVWKPEPGMLKGFPNLKAIFSLGAGVDHLIGRELPPGVPVVRLVDPGLTAGMSEYVAYWVLHHHRHFGDYARQQAEKRWQHLSQRPPEHRRVGIMGLGVMGRDALEKLKPFGFDLAGWSRTEHRIDGVATFHGRDGLGPFLERTEILVCLLPLTPGTEGIIGAETIARLPEGAVIVNAARGGHVVDEDLLAALASGHLAAATLDVFHAEPLPPEHPYWTHAKVTLTPHAASLTKAETGAVAVAANIRLIENGEDPAPVVDLATGY